MAEELTIASIVSTLTANDPQVRRVKILIEGKERETLAGHADLTRFYSSAEMEALVKDAK
jgi:spore germination protein GerM